MYKKKIKEFEICVCVQTENHLEKNVFKRMCIQNVRTREGWRSKFVDVIHKQSHAKILYFSILS